MSEQQGSKRRVFKFDNSSKKPKTDEPKESAPVGGSEFRDSSIGGTLTSVGVSPPEPAVVSGTKFSFLENPLRPGPSLSSQDFAVFPYVPFSPRPWLQQNTIDTYGDVQMLCGAALESVLTMGLPPSSPGTSDDDDPAAAANPVSSPADSGADPDDGPHPESESNSDPDPD